MLGCKCIHTLKHHGNQKTLRTSGLEVSVAPLKCHFIRPSQRNMFCFPARFLYRGTLIPKNNRKLLKILKIFDENLNFWPSFSCTPNQKIMGVNMLVDS